MLPPVAEELRLLGFDPVIVLDGAACGIPEKRLILCVMRYRAAVSAPEVREAVIHPYYPVSQQAYRTARGYAEQCRSAGIPVFLRNDLHIKSVLNRLPFLRRGKNTLSYLPQGGSRFHIQILTADLELPVTCDPEPEEHAVSCGACTRCLRACPTGAIAEEGFLREKCLRFWMMNGRKPPHEIAGKMGNRFIGCDVCESCCPMNRGEERQAPLTVPLRDLLTGEVGDLNLLIGANYALPNRVLTQACVLSAALGRTDLIPELRALLARTRSPAVRETAEEALARLSEATDGNKGGSS